jgi:hypothetical protein
MENSATGIILDQSQKNDRDNTQDIIENTFISDYGIVKVVNGDGTVDVSHAVIRSLKDGTSLGETVSHSIQVLWPVTGQMSVSSKLTVGDFVLLIGMKHYIDLSKFSAPEKQTSYIGYTKETMKALPMAVVSNTAQVQLYAENGKLVIKNDTQSLKSALDALTSALNAFSNATARSAITAGNASSTTLATAINVLLGTLNTAIGSVTASIDGLLGS